MREEITKQYVANMCSDFNDVVLVGLNESKEEFPYSNACINFITELKEQGLNATLRFFSEDLRGILYNEIKKYLTR